MLNKILSKKIKSPLSLRGLFTFCHSRESGNPSSLSLRGTKQRSNLNKGFSLIELMVAITILAMAIFGIFQAYSTGFMGMADARDRTVATNYLQQTIEDFKNMDFNKVKDKSVTLIPGTKYHRGSIVLDLEKQGEIVTLKRVITQVRWMDRDGKLKTEETSTLLYNKPNTSKVGYMAVKIVLYAKSYYTVLPTKNIELVAEIRDENGNIFDWNGPIAFSIITKPVNDPPLGHLPSEPYYSVDAINGVAECIYTAEEVTDVEGIERIEAMATVGENDLTDTINIRVTTGPVAILLELPVDEDDNIISSYPAEVDQSVKVDLIIVKADYEQEADEYSGTINLSAEGPGTLSTNEIILSGTPTASFIVNSNGTPGIVKITASALDLDMGYTEVTFTGQPYAILVSTQKKSIYPSEEITIKVTIVDENNTPVHFGEPGSPKYVVISDIPDEYGALDGNSGSINLSFEGEKYKTCVFKAAAMGLFPQEITITADDNLGELNQGPVKINSVKVNILNPIVAHHIYVSFDDTIELDADPIYPSMITAHMLSEEGDSVSGSYIIFHIKSGPGSFSNSATMDTITLDTMNGLATATLYPDKLTTSGLAIIEIYSNDLPNGGLEGPPGNPGNPIEIEVLFHQESAPDHINLVAEPSPIYIGGQTCTLTATVVDEWGVTYSSYQGLVQFTITDDTGSVSYSDLEVNAVDGIAYLTLTSTDNTGIISITAETLELTDDVSTASPTTVQVKEVDIELVPYTTFYYDSGKIVMFNINITGPELNLQSMLIEWGSGPEKLKIIEIKSPSTDDNYNPIIDVGNVSSQYTENNVNANLLPGESTIRLTFSKNMDGQSLVVTFNTNVYTEKITVVE